jgi:ribosomal protein S18 acetylase RimI-like enzyme
MDSEVYGRLYPEGWRASQRQAVEAVCAAQKTRVWVAEVGASAVGFVALELHPEDSIGEIYILAVDPDHKGSLETALTEFALVRVQDAGMAVAMVDTGGDPGHAAAPRTYEKAGCVRLPIARYFKNL